MTTTPETTPEEVKACCATAYSSDLVALLLGQAYHPGGLALTRRLADQLTLRPGQQVLDVASGRGTTARLLAAEYGVDVTGIDLSAANVAIATAEAGDLAGVRFQVGDAEQLPVPDAGFDAVVCECAWCTFPDKPTAAAEFARVLRPGGRLGVTDVTAQPDRLPPELASLAARVACIADARPTAGYVALLAGAGLRVRGETERHDDAMTRMIDQIEARLKLVAITSPQRAAALGLDLDRASEILGAARTAVANGVLGYTLIIADKAAH
ncbi:MAG: methyltransferase domain-containing protein [Micromonosporaceae bacterium]|nr:methyltransferase domain-containing protein [Micromonosporaceae bacterium]